MVAPLEEHVEFGGHVERVLGAQPLSTVRDETGVFRKEEVAGWRGLVMGVVGLAAGVRMRAAVGR